MSFPVTTGKDISPTTSIWSVLLILFFINLINGQRANCVDSADEFNVYYVDIINH